MFPSDLIGLNIVALKGYIDKRDGRKKYDYITVEYVMLSDGETFIYLEDQDYYSYHDCDPSAKTLNVIKDAYRWGAIMEDKEHFPDATVVQF